MIKVDNIYILAFFKYNINIINFDHFKVNRYLTEVKRQKKG